MTHITTPAPHHCERCGAPLVRVRNYPTGRVLTTGCYHCAQPDLRQRQPLPRFLRRYLHRRYRMDCTLEWYVKDGRDWRRLLRWRALRGDV
ncbi:MAG: hypothetical protein AMXMBFR64_57410 [Myxococcales bacterium]